MITDNKVKKKIYSIFFLSNAATTLTDTRFWK